MHGKEPQRRCFTLRVRAGREEEYRRRHEAVWPELVAAMKAAGIRDMTLFMRGREVIGTFACDDADPAAALARLDEAEVSARWDAYMGDVIESFDELEPVAVWHLA